MTAREKRAALGDDAILYGNSRNTGNGGFAYWTKVL
jgi:hypothetical protein